MTVEGIDCSHWQPTTPNLSGIGFLFARATYGRYRDDRYAMHMANTRNAGKVFGAYHFGRNAGIDTIAAQVDAFLAVAGTADLLALDLERDGANVSMTQAQAAQFIRTVQNRGKQIGLYHSDSGFPSLGQDFDWVAKWGPTPPARHYDFWQYQGTTLDRNTYQGSLSQLKAFVHPSPTSGSVKFPRGVAFWLYTVDEGPTPNRVISRKSVSFPNGSGAPCGRAFATVWPGYWPPGPPYHALVKITDGFLAGKWVDRSYVNG